MATIDNGEKAIEALYVGYFGRVGDPAGVSYWVDKLNSGLSIGQIAAAFSTQPEATRLHNFLSNPTTTNPDAITAFVTDVYHDLLNRQPESAGLQYWTQLLEAANGNPSVVGQFVEYVIGGAQGSDSLTVQNKASIAQYFTDGLASAKLPYGSGADQIAHTVLASITSDPASVFAAETVINNYISSQIVTAPSSPSTVTVTLTTGTDTVVGGGGDYIYNAVVDNAAGLTGGGAAQTLNVGDTITGGAGSNILNITDDGLGSWIGASTGLLGSSDITGITKLNISSREGIANSGSPGFDVGSAVDLTGWTRLTALNVTASNNYYNIMKVGDNTAVSIVTSGPSSEYVLTFGGSTITINNTSIEYDYNYVTGGSHTTAVSATGTAQNYIYDQHNSGNNGYDGTGTTPGWSAGANSIATFSAINQDDNSSNYIYSDALTTLNLTNDSYSYSYIYAAAGTRSLAINLNNGGNSTVHPGQELFVRDDTATSVTVTASGTASHGFVLQATAATTLTFNDSVDLKFYDGAVSGSQHLYAPQATSLTINGAGAFTSDVLGIGATAAINASGSSGGVTVELASAASGAGTQSFIGGSGRDIVTIGGGQTGHVTGGSANNNEIILSGIVSASEVNIDASIVSHFSTLGIAGLTGGTFNMTGLSAYTSFDLIGSGDDVTFTNVSNGTTLTIDNSNANAITLQTGDTSGASDQVNLVIGTSTTAGITVAGVTLDDASGNGIGTVTVVSNGNGTSNNSITLNKSVATLNLSGTEAISFGTVMHGTAGININGASENSAVSLTLSGVTSSGHSDTVTLGNGNNIIIDTSAGAGATVHLTLGNGDNTVIVGATATNTVSLGTGQNSLIEAAGGNVAVSFGTHAVGTVDNVTAGASTSGTITPAAVISGMNLAGSDTITISGDAGANSLITFTATQVDTFGGNPTTLAAAVAGILSASGGNLAQHAVGEFVFEHNTYFVEQAGATGSAYAAGDTVVELVGTQTITSATTVSSGVLHLNG